MIPRTGIGTDVHAFAAGRDLWLAGLPWPGETGLAGHSDADAAAHACVDAVLSAAGLGDIGALFGTDRSEIAGAPRQWSGLASMTTSTSLTHSTNLNGPVPMGASANPSSPTSPMYCGGTMGSDP